MVAVGDDDESDDNDGDDVVGSDTPSSDVGEREYTGKTAGDSMRVKRGEESMDDCRWTRLGLSLTTTAAVR